MRAFHVESARPSDRPRVVEAIVEAFADDPAARWMYPDDDRYFEFFPDFVEAFGGRAFESGMVHHVDHARGAALWLAPGTQPDDEGVVELIARSIPEEDCAAMFALFEEMSRYHPAQPHWHLPLIGVEPRRQGNGYGSALLRIALARCDAEGYPAYLESSNERNIPLYQRHGFEILGRIQIGTSPPITPMLRRPR